MATMLAHADVTIVRKITNAAWSCVRIRILVIAASAFAITAHASPR